MQMRKATDGHFIPQLADTAAGIGEMGAIASGITTAVSTNRHFAKRQAGMRRRIAAQRLDIEPFGGKPFCGIVIYCAIAIEYIRIPAIILHHDQHLSRSFSRFA